MIRNQIPFLCRKYLEYFENRYHAYHFINRLQASSVLEFPFDHMVDN